MNDPTEQARRSDPRNARHDQPDNTYKYPAVIDLTKARDQETQYACYPRFSHCPESPPPVNNDISFTFVAKTFTGLGMPLVCPEKLMNDQMNSKEESDTRKDRQGNERTFSAVVVDLGDKIASGDIKCHATCQRQSVRYR